MFHNSTTLYRFPKNTAFNSGENRVVYGFWEETGTAAKKMAGFGKSVGRRVIANPFVRFAFAPLYWPAQIGSMAYKGAGYAITETERTGRTLYEAGAGMVEGTVRPALTLALSPLTDVKMNLWDLPWATAEAAVCTPIALAATPVEVYRASRDAVKSVLKAGKDLLTLNFGEIIADSRKAVADTFGIVSRPVQNWFNPNFIDRKAGISRMVDTVVTSKMQYFYLTTPIRNFRGKPTYGAMRDAGKEIREGYKHVLGARKLASATMDKIRSGKPAEEDPAKSREEEKKESGKKEEGAKGGEGKKKEEKPKK
jgi:hypothetical protein